MRISFAQSLKCGTPIHKEHVLHEQIISQMGNYQEYLKKSIVPLRDPHADPDLPKQKGPTFGNPWKVTLFYRWVEIWLLRIFEDNIF